VGLRAYIALFVLNLENRQTAVFRRGEEKIVILRDTHTCNLLAVALVVTDLTYAWVSLIFSVVFPAKCVCIKAYICESARAHNLVCLTVPDR
jgi:hypothetical protein